MKSGTRHSRLGPYSRTLDRGAIGRTIDGRSPEGRFLRGFESSMTAHVGGNPTIAEKMLIRRLARVALRLEAFDEKISGGAHLTDHDERAYGAMENRYRLLIRELGIKGAAAKAPSLAEHIAARAAQRNVAA